MLTNRGYIRTLFKGLLIFLIFGCSVSNKRALEDYVAPALFIQMNPSQFTVATSCYKNCPDGGPYSRNDACGFDVTGDMPTFSWEDIPAGAAATLIFLESDEYHYYSNADNSSGGCKPSDASADPDASTDCVHMVVSGISADSTPLISYNNMGDFFFGTTYPSYNSRNELDDADLIHTGYNGPCPDGYSYDQNTYSQLPHDISKEFYTYKLTIISISSPLYEEFIYCQTAENGSCISPFPLRYFRYLFRDKIIEEHTTTFTFKIPGT